MLVRNLQVEGWTGRKKGLETAKHHQARESGATWSPRGRKVSWCGPQILHKKHWAKEIRGAPCVVLAVICQLRRRWRAPRALS